MTLFPFIKWGKPPYFYNIFSQLEAKAIYQIFNVIVIIYSITQKYGSVYSRTYR